MRALLTIITLGIFSAIIGCAGGHSPVTTDLPDQQPPKTLSYDNNRVVWGFWDVKIPEIGASPEISPNREIAMHLNILKMLESKPCSGCLNIEDFTWLPDNTIQCDLWLHHPFSEALRFTGFDVRGIFISDGETYFPESDKWLSFDGTNPRLLNPDGYTHLFNPTDFPEGSAPYPALAYIKGKMATNGDLSATLNPFVAYGVANERRMFPVGASESRTVRIHVPLAPIKFGYAVDVSWVPVQDVVDPLIDFPPQANCHEPYSLEMELTGHIDETQGSSTPVHVAVFDHQGKDSIGSVSIECPDLFDGEITLDYSSQTGDESWMCTGTIANSLGVSQGTYPVLIKAVSLDQDPNPGQLAAYQVGELDVFQPDSGNLIWAKRAGGHSSDQPNAITPLSDNSTIAVGFFEYNAIFGEGEPNETTLISEGDWDAFIARYKPDGKLAWAKCIEGVGVTNAYGVTALSDDSFLVTGYFTETVTFGEGEPNETTFNAGSYGWCCFIARYNPDGTLVWAKQTKAWPASGGSLTTLSDDSVVLTGVFWGSVIFGKGEPNETILTETAGGARFIARYNSDGSLVWAKHIADTDTSQTSTSEDVAVTTLTDDSVVITGKFEESITFGQGEPNETTLYVYNELITNDWDIFVARYMPDGTLAWVKQASGPAREAAYAIADLSDNSILVTGYSQSLTTFNPGEIGETTLDSAGAFIARYNQDGSLVLVKSISSNDSTYGFGITALSDDSYVAVGDFIGTTTFGEGEPNETVLDSDGGFYVARYNPDNTLMWVKESSTAMQSISQQIMALSDDSTVVIGGFGGVVLFGEGEQNETALISDGDEDICIARFSP